MKWALNLPMSYSEIKTKLNAKKKLERHHIVDITKLFHIDHHQNGKTLTSGPNL